jgi:Carboxypeptidase regulatory-like domain
MGAKVVAGRVLMPDGRPVAGANVMFAHGPVALPDIAQVTDATGAFALAAPAEGSYRIVVNVPGLGMVERDVDVGGASEIFIEIVAAKEP